MVFFLHRIVDEETNALFNNAREELKFTKVPCFKAEWGD